MKTFKFLFLFFLSINLYSADMYSNEVQSGTAVNIPTVSIDSDKTIETPMIDTIMTFTLNIDPVATTTSTIKYYTVDATAISGTDYEGISETNLTLPLGATSVDINVTIFPYSSGYFYLIVDDPYNAGIADGNATGSIFDTYALCYTNVISDGGKCKEAGDFHYWDKHAQECTSSAVIVNRELDNPLSNTVVYKLYDNNATNGSCTTGTGTCTGPQTLNIADTDSSDSVDYNDFNGGYTYNIGSFAIDSNTTIADIKTYDNNADISNIILHGTYTSEGLNYSRRIYSCETGAVGIAATGSADIVNDWISDDNYNSGIHYIKTKIAQESNTTNTVVTGVHLNKTTLQAEPFSPDDHGQIYNIIPYLADESCDVIENVLDPATGDPLVIEIQGGTSNANGNMLVSNTSSKERYMKMIIVDSSSLSVAGQKCILNSSTTGNFARIAQCANSEVRYVDAFGTNAWARCGEGNGEPCLSQNHGVADPDSPTYNPLYDNELGCYMCTFDIQPVCTTDNFAIRPDAFKVFGENQYKRASEDFNITIKATDAIGSLIDSGTVNDVNGATGYDASLSSLTLSSNFYTPTADETALMRSHTGTEDVSICPNAGGFGVLNGTDNFTNGEINANILFTETGVLTLNVSETLEEEFALVDLDDTPDIDRLITPSDVILYQNDINKTTLLVFVPYKFQTQLETNTTTTQNWLYMDTIDSTVFSTPLMSADMNYTITAQDMYGTTLENYTSTCFPDTDTNCPARNGLKLNTTFDLFLDSKLNSSADANISLYSEDNESNPIWTMTPKQTLTVGDNNVREWISPLNFTYGIGRATVHFNIDRNVTPALNPITISIVDANTSTLWMANPGSPKEFNGDIKNETKTFLYGRTHASRQRYTGDTGTANIYYEAYCFGTDTTGNDCNKTLLPNGVNSDRTDDIRWFINPFHLSNSGNAGKVVEKDSLFRVTSAGITTGNHPDNSTLMTYNKSQGFPYKTTMENNASRWLIYNEDDPTATRNEFPVEFEGGDSGWSGKHETNTTTKDPGTATTNRRSMW
ncbi:MAG: hypothetical protein U9Q29_03665 [Campylobacterota bacterium]|nr:hypothetical protein [Campylobacterota bacterium]